MAKILLIEDHGIVRDALRAVLSQRGHEVLNAAKAAEGVELFRLHRPDLVILDRDLPDMPGSEALKRLRGEDPGARVIVLTGFPDEAGEAKYRELGVSAFLSKGMGIEALLKAVDRALAVPESGGAAAPDPPRILVADDEPSVRALLRRFLERKGYRVETAADGLEAVERAGTFEPHLVLLDFRMPGLDGLEVIKRLRAARAPCAVIMITAEDDLETARACMSLGASDYVVKPFNFDYLEMSVWAKILTLAP